jgi:hypothetical protein
MRRFVIGIVALACALGIAASPAGAKGIARAHFWGQGLGAGGVKLVWARGINQVGLVAPKKARLSDLGHDRADLGTGYRASYRMDYAPRHVLRQIVYPYAEGGPITFTPWAQHLGQDYESFKGGWYEARPRLFDMLLRHGFPERDPAAAIENEGDQYEGDRPASDRKMSLPNGRTVITAAGAIGLVVVAIRWVFAYGRALYPSRNRRLDKQSG